MYTKTKKINFNGPIRHKADVNRFFDALLSAGINFHPDDSFKNIVHMKTGKKTFSTAEASRLDDLMGDAFRVADPYACAIAAFERFDRHR